MRQKIAEFIDAIMGLRKFIAFIALLLISIIFRVSNLMDGGQFTDLMKAVTIAFFASNGLEHYVSMVKDQIADKAKSLVPAGAPAKEEG